MSAASIKATRDGWGLLAMWSRQITRLPLEDWLEAINRAESIGPFVDPTLYIHGVQSMREWKRLIEVALPLKQFVQSMQSENVDGRSDPSRARRGRTRGTLMSNKPLSGLWRKDSHTPEGKYLVKRRDGTVVEWPSFVIGARDPAAPSALRAYAVEAKRLGMNEQYITDILELAAEFERYRASHGAGDPDRGRHRVDDPATIDEMRTGKSA